MSAVYYLDSSVWVKRYFAEAGSSWVNTLFSRGMILTSTVLGYIEVAAALARRSQPGASVRALQYQLTTEWNDMLQFELTSELYDQAVSIAWEQRLRGADAIHLSAARQLRDQTSGRSLDFVLLTADTELIRAGKNFQLVITNPAELA